MGLFMVVGVTLHGDDGEESQVTRPVSLQCVCSPRRDVGDLNAGGESAAEWLVVVR